MKMLSIQQLIKAFRKLQNSGATTTNDLAKRNLKRVVAGACTTTTITNTTKKYAGTPIPPQTVEDTGAPSSTTSTSQISLSDMMISPSQPQLNEYEQQQLLLATNSSHIQKQQLQQSTQIHKEVNSQSSRQLSVSIDSFASENGSIAAAGPEYRIAANALNNKTPTTNYLPTRSQRIHKFYEQNCHHFHTHNNQSLQNKQIYSAMSSLAAAEPKSPTVTTTTTTANGPHPTTDAKTPSCNGTQQNNSSEKPCFNTGFGEILKFMELIGNLKHTKRTGWVLRNVSDPESISGHMYRMSMMTFLLDGSEGLNQIRCMELALVHDLAESVVGDLTPFCGVSRSDKRAMELKAMEDICKLIEPRGKRIMELFEEYETGESAESKFVKDLDRLDMIMQAFEYEKRDNCLLKHQEFFDSTEGKFNHPFVKKLVDEIYEQRKSLARAKGATPPPPVEVPDMDALPSTNSQRSESETADVKETQIKSNTNTTTS